MQTNFEQLIKHAKSPELSVEPIPPKQMERIRELTMKNIPTSNTKRRQIRPIGLLIAAVLLVTALCGTAIAAYENGWFGFDRIFGEKAAVVSEYVVSQETLENTTVTRPSYTEDEQQMIDDGTLIVPEQASIPETGATATTDDYQFTLEDLLASPDTLYAVMRVDALNEEAAQQLTAENSGEFGGLFINTLNNSGEGHEKELKNGGMGMDLLQMEGSTAYFLLHNNGGQFAEGDPILFHCTAGNINLFEVPLTHIMDTETTIQMDTSVYDGKGYCFESMTVTPISLVIHGTYTVSADQSWPEVTVTLKDGTSFELASLSNNFQYSEYGTYGSLSSAGTCGSEDPFIRDSWTFSQVLELDEIAEITVDGVSYPVS